MDQQLKLWLAPPIIMGLAYIYFRIKIPLPWSWCFLLQAILLIATGTCGYFYSPEWLYVAISWTLFTLFLVVPKFAIRNCDLCVSTLNPSRLFSYCKIFPYVYWGKMGLFWRDLYRANAFALDGDELNAKKTLKRWREEKLPMTVEMQLDATATGINLLLWDWDKVIEEYETRVCKNKPVTVSLAVQAARAYAEKHNFEAAIRCIELSHLADSKIDPSTLAFVLLPIFSISGQRKYAEKLIATVEAERGRASEFLLLYWRARIESAQGNDEAARGLFAQSIASAQKASSKGLSNFAIWQKRVNLQIQNLNCKTLLPAQDVLDEPMTKLWQTFADSSFVSSTILPKKSKPAVTVLCVIVVLAYLMSGCVDIVTSTWAQPFLNLNVSLGNSIVSLSEKLGTFSFDNLLLDRQAVFEQNQYYRLFTYMFLHGNITHLFLNVIGLYWFGRRAASIFSSKSFVFLFVITGIIAGLAQIVLSAVPAVGASGGVLGIFGADFAGIFRLKNKLPQKVRKAELISMSVLAISQLAMDHVIPKVAGEAHMGGLIAGLLIGCLLPLSIEREPT